METKKEEEDKERRKQPLHWFSPEVSATYFWYRCDGLYHESPRPLSPANNPKRNDLHPPKMGKGGGKPKSCTGTLIGRGNDLFG
jgi:hypothetical protein